MSPRGRKSAEVQVVVSSCNQLTEALAATASALVAALESRDPYTAGHGARVGKLSAAIGARMGWDESRVTGLQIAGMVHDIGKISVPAEILGKHGTLSPAESALIREHPLTGYRILKDVPFLWPIAEVTLQHHEKLDGSGYPRGLSGAEILPEAKILSVADIAEALGSDRPYRKAAPLAEMIDNLWLQSGVQLDADAVHICIELFEEFGFEELFRADRDHVFTAPQRGKRSGAAGGTDRKGTSR